MLFLECLRRKKGEGCPLLSALMPALSSFCAFLPILCRLLPCGDESSSFLFCSADCSDCPATSSPVKPRAETALFCLTVSQDQTATSCSCPLGSHPINFQPRSLMGSIHHCTVTWAPELLPGTLQCAGQHSRDGLITEQTAPLPESGPAWGFIPFPAPALGVLSTFHSLLSSEVQFHVIPARCAF